jgi:8-oxo-dGTP pyrophosphatase MutT (NUDIX family)
MAEANEPPTVAARRELREELALDIEIGRLLYLEWVPPHDPWDDQLAMIFDGGTLTGEQIGSLRIADEELTGFDFVSVSDAAGLLRHYVHRRLTAAMEAQAAGTVAYLESTEPRLGES